MFRKLFSLETLCKFLFYFTWFFQLLACLLPKYEHKGAPEGFCYVFFCLFFANRKKKSVSGLVQAWSGWDLWLRWTAKDYSSLFFVASPPQRTWAVLLPHPMAASFPEGHLQLSPPPMLAPCGLAVAQGALRGLWGCCAVVLLPVHSCREGALPTEVGARVCSREQRLLWSSAGHRAGCINIFMLFYSSKKRNYGVLKLLICCSWLLHYFCVISQKTILGSPILLLLMSRRKIPFTAVVQKQEGADAGKKSFENYLEEGENV